MKLITGIAIIAGTAVAASAGNVIFSTDFEDNDGGFNGTGDWQYGTPVGFADAPFGGPEPVGGNSGESAWGTVIGGAHNPSTTSSLTTTIDATGFTGLSLTFFEWLDSGGNTFDTAEVFVNGDLQTLRDGGPTTWREVTLDLSAYDNSMLDIEFRFVTTGVVERVGWYIDDVSLTGIPTPGAAGLLAMGGLVAARRRRA